MKAPSEKFVYEIAKKPGDLPYVRKGSQAQLRFSIADERHIEIRGNGAGLEYLAKYLLQLMWMKEKNGYHLHLDAETGRVDDGSADVTIWNTDLT